MSIFPIHRYRLFDDPFDRFFGDQLDFFDPWSDFDTFPTALSILPNAFRWINEPLRLTHSSTAGNNQRKSPYSEKFRVQLNVAGFNPQSIKTRIEGQKVIVEAKQEDRQQDGDYNIRELRKSYELPEHADTNRLASYVTPNNMLVIEVPIQNPEKERQISQTTNNNQSLTQFGQYLDPWFDYKGFLSGSDFQPRIVDKGNNEKQLEMNVSMKNYRPEEIKVSVKNNELIVQGEHKYKDENLSERSFFFKSTTLPPGTQIDQLKSHLTDDRQLKIEVPYIEQKQPTQSIEHNQQQNTSGQNTQQQNITSQNNQQQNTSNPNNQQQSQK